MELRTEYSNRSVSFQSGGLYRLSLTILMSGLNPIIIDQPHVRLFPGALRFGVPCRPGIMALCPPLFYEPQTSSHSIVAYLLRATKLSQNQFE
jgi:hypothetical protein